MYIRRVHYQIGLWLEGREDLKKRLELTYYHNQTKIPIHPLGRGVAKVVVLLVGVTGQCNANLI